jgi:hypothetical protein
MWPRPRTLRVILAVVVALHGLALALYAIRNHW